MRPLTTNVETAISAARTQSRELYFSYYFSETPRSNRKVKRPEAHEAIGPRARCSAPRGRSPVSSTDELACTS